MSEFKLFSSELLGEKYYMTEHESGLKIYVFPKNMSSTYGIFSVNFGGSVAEYFIGGKRTELPRGCAHFLEHKMFDNPDGNNADDVFSSFGAYDNAYTSSDRTAYIFSATDNISECVEHLLYFVTHPYFTKSSVKKEIGIIAEEIRGCNDDPYDRCYVDLLDAMYVNNPVKNEICGSERSISKITPDVLYKCCEDFYTPENMILVLCGNITPEESLRIVDKVIGRERRHCDLEPVPFEEPKSVSRSYTERKMSVGKPLFCIGVKDCDIPSSPSLRYRKAEAMNILLNMMFSEAGDFYLRMLESGLLSPGFDCGYSSNAKTAYVMMSGESDDPELLLEKIKEQIGIFKAEGLSREDFEREKKCHYSSYVSDFDMTEDIAFALTSYACDGMDLFEYPDIIAGVTFEYLTDLLNQCFADDAFVLSVIKPEK